MTLWLTVVTPTRFPARTRLVEDHARAGERLAGAGRSLDGQNATIQRNNSPARGRDRRFASLTQRRPSRKAWIGPEQKVARRPVRPWPRKAVVANELAEA